MLQTQGRRAPVPSPRSVAERPAATRRMWLVGREAKSPDALPYALRLHHASPSRVSSADLSTVPDEEQHAAPPDVVLINSDQPGGDAVARVQEIRLEAPDALVLLVGSGLAPEVVEAALDAGATVCLSRPGKLAEVTPLPGVTIETPAPRPTGARPRPLPLRAAQLTERERDILGAVAEGHTSARIGRDRYVTEQTVKFHLSNIYRKLGVANRTEASRFALLHNLCGDAVATAG